MYSKVCKQCHFASAIPWIIPTPCCWILGFVRGTKSETDGREWPYECCSQRALGQWDINGVEDPREMLLFICIILRNQSESHTIKTFLQMALLFEPNSFYILLLNLDHECHFEWQLFLALTTTTGQLFHTTNDPGSVGWEYKSEMANMSTNGRLVIALQIGVIGPVLHTALATRLGLVPLTMFSGRYRDLCSQMRVQAALFALDDEGYLNIGSSVGSLEQEAIPLAIFNGNRGTRSAVRSSGFVE
ncbi:unnamed protein product [Penicillium salamii]|nr:unnamed protein product [Penicillium salamii]CAG8421629.1 unnamed protein product [Penicillium salamii]